MAYTSWRILKRDDMCDEREESLVNKILRVWMRLFDGCFILKNLMKSIKILLKKNNRNLYIFEYQKTFYKL